MAANAYPLPRAFIDGKPASTNVSMDGYQAVVGFAEGNKYWQLDGQNTVVASAIDQVFSLEPQACENQTPRQDKRSKKAAEFIRKSLDCDPGSFAVFVSEAAGDDGNDSSVLVFQSGSYVENLG
jgi:hypothetical protein